MPIHSATPKTLPNASRPIAGKRSKAIRRHPRKPARHGYIDIV